ncbi:MAG: hypothetical protein ACRD96_06935, partial [Bryobacteraceae bacterium]
MPHRSGVVLATALCLVAQDAAGPRILRPANESVVPAAPLVIVARGTGELRLDGKPLPAQTPAAGVVTATVTPSPGPHEVALGGLKVRFFAGDAAAPPGWKPFRAHPPAATCDACHTARSGAWSLKPESCFSCHDAKAFAEPHSHNAETLVECQT